MPSPWGVEQVFPLVLVLLGAGAVAGVTAGLLGVGGGIVLVPVLWTLFTSMGVDEGVRMHLAVGTSLATIIATSASSVRAHHRRGAVDVGLLRQWGPWILGGVLVGTAVAGAVRGRVLTLVFACAALVVAGYMGLGRAEWRVAQQLPRGGVRAIIAGVIGALSAMMGIGGGTLSVPLLSLFGYPIHRAIGTAAAIGFLIGVPGAVGFAIAGWNAPRLPPFSVGYVSLIGFALIFPTSTLLAPYGARLAHRLDTRYLRRVFAVFLAVTALRMF
ncbi:MAG: sulfite exporter TauE/SafE family protein [Vicinamibacterales bacterium]